MVLLIQLHFVVRVVGFCSSSPRNGKFQGQLLQSQFSWNDGSHFSKIYKQICKLSVRRGGWHQDRRLSTASASQETNTIPWNMQTQPASSKRSAQCWLISSSIYSFPARSPQQNIAVSFYSAGRYDLDSYLWKCQLDQLCPLASSQAIQNIVISLLDAAQQLLALNCFSTSSMLTSCHTPHHGAKLWKRSVMHLNFFINWMGAGRFWLTGSEESIRGACN